MATRSFSAHTEGLPAQYWLLWAGTLVNRLGSFVMPFLTLYLTTQRAIPVGQAALMVSLFGAGSFIAQLTGGYLADRIGRRPVMLFSLMAAPAAMIALGFARPLPVIAGCTLALGFLTDLYRPAVSAAIADLVPPESRIRAYGYLYWAINLGFAVASVVAGVLAGYTYLALFVGDAVTTFAFGVIVLIGLRETRPDAAARAAHASLRERLAQLGQAPILLLFSALVFGFGLVYMQGHVTLPVDMQSHGLGPREYGLAVAVNGLLIVLVSLPVSCAAGRWPRFGAMAAAALLLGLGFGFQAFADSLPLYALAVAVWTLGEIAAAAVAPAIIADLAPIERRGLYQGVYGSSWSLAFFVGPVLGGRILQDLGAATLWLGCLGLCVVLAGGYLALGALARARA
jgi:MFS family permease